MWNITIAYIKANMFAFIAVVIMASEAKRIVENQKFSKVSMAVDQKTAKIMKRRYYPLSRCIATIIFFIPTLSYSLYAVFRTT